MVADMLPECSGREPHRSRRHRLTERRGDLFGLRGSCRTLHRLRSHYEIAKRGERREETEVDRGSAPLRCVEKLGKGFPVPRRDLARLGLTRRNTDTAVAHHDRRDAVPGRRAHDWVPADLSVVMGMRVDKARRHDKVGSIDHALAAFGHLTDFRDTVARDGDIAAKPRCTRAVDDRTVLDYQVISHELFLCPSRFAPRCPAFSYR